MRIFIIRRPRRRFGLVAPYIYIPDTALVHPRGQDVPDIIPTYSYIYTHDFKVHMRSGENFSKKKKKRFLFDGLPQSLLRYAPSRFERR